MWFLGLGFVASPVESSKSLDIKQLHMKCRPFRTLLNQAHLERFVGGTVATGSFDLWTPISVTRSFSRLNEPLTSRSDERGPKGRAVEDGSYHGEVM